MKLENKNYLIKLFRKRSPRYALSKVKLIIYQNKNPQHPWLTENAISILSSFLKPIDCGFEWGSGNSTIWFGRKIRHLASVEHNKIWHEKISDKLKSDNMTNVDYMFYDLSEKQQEMHKTAYIESINKFGKDSLDFVLVDGKYRDICANVALDKIRPGGIIIVDNVNTYIPCNSRAPKSRSKNAEFASPEWKTFFDRIKSWRYIWTTNNVWDTAIWFKPVNKESVK